MPELPEVETTRRGIEPWLAGHVIERIIVRQPKLRWPVDDAIQSLQGEKILSLSRRAKYILVETARGTAIWHLGMSGSLRLVEADVPPGKHDHIDWLMSNGKVLRYHDTRRFGALLFVPPGQVSEHLTHLGPEPLSDEFTPDYLYQRTRGKSQAIKTFIMDGKVVVGVGNIYANESLFKAGIRPQAAAGKLTKPRCERLVEEIRDVLAKAIAQGGTTLRDFVGGDGKPGYFAQQLLVYGRGGEDCKVCKTPLKELRQGQRATVYCPACQR
ncbi:bifunctional DNA-formamidopyrimidine glycosylase/DNA-(apurinic or apyrimidinic site) lyase [Thalassolituus sp. LLYu03]|uniref:bifunctional DNA-formamidopyrimidine glycosylase/DNA-(apurinic or apyrimidinic site) lyase n=1 Tax=Thalassolituus sp. LLYu03 TaxID=3421656 RepID=UPI003D2DF478